MASTSDADEDKDPPKLDLKLEPLGPELKEYFRQRGISAATLQRNGIMQQQQW